MREFVLYSRTGRTDSNFTSLRKAGRLDVVQECAVASVFLSHGLRKNVVFHAFLGGPPSPPLHLSVDGATLRDVRTDQETWKKIFKNILSGRSHPGIDVEKKSFQALLKEKADETSIYALEEGGKDIFNVEIDENPLFVLGDHIGLPRKVEGFALRYGSKVSLAKPPYLAGACINILNYLLDRKGIL
ncbi:MAG: tRNA (pseudouridine(54)-N(1))-methyltransferase TrmY [Thermoproteota archaeon]